ncbi:mannose-specific lectin [Selaginella moellendorffii]|nr:mannose-specific lectin [Selaginella moellendorffii]|eukprot:XP_002973748.2 mannose-specific lectin [Selaginella moellendorffii]
MAKLLIFYYFLALALLTVCSARDTLGSGETLYQGDELRSQSGYVSLRMQRDCNLVLYGGQGDFNPIWASNTGGSGRNCYLTLQPDGNLVVYDGNRRALWASGTDRSGGNTLRVQDDGNVVLYRPVWSTNTGRVNYDFKVTGEKNSSSSMALE